MERNARHLHNVQLILFVLYVFISLVYCGNITDVERLHKTLLSGYNKNIRPITNQSEVMNVSVAAYIRSIQELDEVTEEFSFTGALSLSWTDIKMVWNASEYGGIDEVHLSTSDVWIPDIILTTTSDKSDTMVKSWQTVEYRSDGTGQIVVGGRIQAVCSINVEKFPFDKQVCKINFSGWGSSPHSLRFTQNKEHADLSRYSSNLVWDLTDTKTIVYVLDNWPAYDLHFYLERKSSFTIISLVAPLQLMNFLQLLVFVLVPQSGERVSYSITVLLAIAVFMSIISNVLPASSEPIPIITYKLMIDLVTSVAITTVSILNLRVFHKDEKRQVPKYLLMIYKMLCNFTNISTKVSAVRDNEEVQPQMVDVDDLDDEDTQNEVKLPESKDKIPRDHHVNWIDISCMIDIFSFVTFFIFSFISFIIFIFTMIC